MANPKTTRRLLDPKLDIVFWKLFATEQNRPLLVALLNAVLRPAVPIEEVVVVGDEPDVLGVDGKQVALDLRVRLGSGEVIDVEVQTRRHAALRERALYYWARLYSEQLQRGEQYGSLRRCAVIFILDFEELASARFHSVFRLREETDGARLTEHLELHFIELPKWSRALDRNDEPNLSGWCRFLTAAEDEELEELAMESPILKQAKDALEELSADPELRSRAWHRETVLNADRMQRVADKQEARAEGLVEGRADMLLRLMTRKFGALTEQVVARVSRGSERELEDWCDRVLNADTIDSMLSG